jgi:hypothetical protein
MLFWRPCRTTNDKMREFFDKLQLGRMHFLFDTDTIRWQGSAFDFTGLWG